jgi:glycosyltransferase involved in cell wall biosynthesis
MSPSLAPTVVIQVIGSFHQGGTEQQAVQLARLLHASERYRVVVACLNAEGALRPRLEELGIPIVPFPLTSLHDRQTLAQLRRFVQLVRDEGARIVQAHDYYTNLFGMTAATVARVPARVASLREVGGVRTPVQRRVERVAFGLAHAVVANAHAVRAVLLAAGVPSAKAVVIPNAVDPARVAAGERCRSDRLRVAVGSSSTVTPPVVTIVANMHHAVKDHPLFLRAARRVLVDSPTASFVLAGEGALQPAYRRLAAELGLAERAHFIGRCDAIGDLLAASDVCVLTSRAEGSANAILEYMAAGRPVVATDVGGAREAIVDGQTGYLVPAGDDVALADRITWLLKDAARAQAMGQAARAVIERNYSLPALLGRTEALYQRLLAGQQPSK